MLVELESKAKADALLKAASDEPLLPKQTKVKVVTSSDGLSFFDRLEADCLAFREEGEKRKAKRKAEKEEKKKRKAEEAEKGEGDAKPSAKKAKKKGKGGGSSVIIIAVVVVIVAGVGIGFYCKGKGKGAGQVTTTHGMTPTPDYNSNHVRIGSDDNHFSGSDGNEDNSPKTVGVVQRRISVRNRGIKLPPMNQAKTQETWDQARGRNIPVGEPVNPNGLPQENQQTYEP